MLDPKPGNVQIATNMIERRKETLERIEEFKRTALYQWNKELQDLIERIRIKAEAEIKEIYYMNIEDADEDASEKEEVKIEIDERDKPKTEDTTEEA